MPIESEVKEIPVDKIDIDEQVNVRRSNIYEKIEELAKNIEAFGLQNPIVVAPYDKGRYKLISGQRRLIATRDYLKRKMIRATILEHSVDDMQARILSLAENLARRDLETKDIRIVCDYFYAKSGDVKKVAEQLALSEQTVRKYLSYNKLVTERVKKIVEEEKKITVDDAKKIAQFVPDPEKQYRIAERLKEITTRPEKNRVFDAIREGAHEEPEEIFKRAERMKHRHIIQLEFTERESIGLDEASKDLENDVATLVKTIIVDWLEARGYVR